MHLQSEWSKRLELNNAPSEFPFLLGTILCEVPYMDVPAINWIARRDPRHRIFIWGHTHNPLMLAKHFDGRQRGYIYANTGSWVDDNVSIYDTRSFVDLYYGEGRIYTGLCETDWHGRKCQELLRPVMVEEMIFTSSTKNNSKMKKLIFLSLLAVMFVSCHRELRKSPDIRIDPNYVVTYVGDTTLVRVRTLSDGKQKVSVADTTIAKATLPVIPGPIFVLGVKEGTTTLKFEVGLTQAFTWGEETCTVEVRPARAD